MVGRSVPRKEARRRHPGPRRLTLCSRCGAQGFAPAGRGAAERPGPRKGQRRLSLRYLVQTAEAPPTFRLDVNDRSLMTRDYGFWLENRLRRRFDLDGVPLVLEVRTRP